MNFHRTRPVCHNDKKKPAIWFPAVRTGTGTDVFTERLAHGLQQCGLRTEITWLPLRSEYLPWTVRRPLPPSWANVVHINTWLPPRLLPKNLPVLATIHHAIHHPDVMQYKSFIRSAYHRWWITPNERRILRCADRVVAVSHFAAETAKKTLADIDIHVIYNGIDTLHFSPRMAREKNFATFRMIYIGKWNKLKGVDLLPKIMKELGDNYELFYTGGPAALREGASMPANMHDMGKLAGENAVLQAMHEADALLFPSRSEGFGLVAAEAMACGLPVIGTFGSSLVEIVDNGKSGLLCAQGNVQAFVSAIRKLATDKDFYSKMAETARSRAENLFSHTTALAAYLEEYKNILSR